MFFFKKLISQFIMPLAVSLELMLLGLLLLYFTRKQKTAKALMSIGLLLLIAMSFNPVSGRLVRPLETRYPPLVVDAGARTNPASNLHSVKWIVVLGGGHSTDLRIPAISRLSSASLARVAEGIRLYHELPGNKLLLSGGKVFHPTSDADSMAQVAEKLGVKKDDIVLEEESRDTEDEARFIHSLVKSNRFILVTSAYHMPRAMALFRRDGMNPIAAPTDYSGNEDNPEGANIYSFFPDPNSLVNASVAVHEYIGILWAKLRGKA